MPAEVIYDAVRIATAGDREAMKIVHWSKSEQSPTQQ